MPRHTPKDSGKTGKHSDLSKEVRVLDENDLLSFIEKLTSPAFLLILDGIVDIHNFGACLRTAAAAGVQAVIAPRDRSAPLNETVRRIACGGAEKVPVARVTNLSRTITELKRRGVWIVGAAHEADRLLYDTDLTGPMAIIVGSEEKGLRRLTRENCDFLVRIPMPGDMENLNVSVAAGICLFEAVRQRIVGKPD